MRREGAALVFGRLIPSVVGLSALFAHLFGAMSTEDATYYLLVATFLLVMEHVLNGGEK